jgi:hypothetical protein
MRRRTRLDPGERRVRAILWALALVVMIAAAAYQRRTGPTYPVRGSYELAGESWTYRLIRSESTEVEATISVPAPRSGATGTVVFARYPSDDQPTARSMRLEPDERQDGWRLVAELPRQPPAGKMAYHVELAWEDDSVRIPAAGEGEIVLRYKGDVPLWVLLPHVVLMFLSLLVGIRAGFAAALERWGVRELSWTTLGGLSVGGMVLGPVVQWFAFGEFWTGFPRGYDLTDNKTLIMWTSWLVACVALALARSRTQEFFGRLAICIAALVTIGVFLIPHSLGGSELDYGQVDAGVSPAEAVKQGLR